MGRSLVSYFRHCVFTWLTMGRQFFKKSERFGVPLATNKDKDSLYFNSENHGTSGPIHSTYSTEFGGSHPYWHSTLNRLGVETNKNHFGGSNMGVVRKFPRFSFLF
jgi:hypothetical protein